jgi:hypothetical protein
MPTDKGTRYSCVLTFLILIAEAFFLAVFRNFSFLAGIMARFWSHFSMDHIGVNARPQSKAAKLNEALKKHSS